MTCLAFAVHTDTIAAPAARSGLLALAPLAASALASAAQAALAVGTCKEFRNGLIRLLDARQDSAVTLRAVLVALFDNPAAVRALRVCSALVLLQGAALACRRNRASSAAHAAHLAMTRTSVLIAALHPATTVLTLRVSHAVILLQAAALAGKHIHFVCMTYKKRAMHLNLILTQFIQVF